MHIFLPLEREFQVKNLTVEQCCLGNCARLWYAWLKALSWCYFAKSTKLVAFHVSDGLNIFVLPVARFHFIFTKVMVNDSQEKQSKIALPSAPQTHKTNTTKQGLHRRQLERRCKRKASVVLKTNIRQHYNTVLEIFITAYIEICPFKPHIKWI